ncbi:MAG: ligand-binding sensor domain-containing protein [Candidatus Latescibacterota bacterium]
MVYFLLIDREELLWCATEKGVCRYDGNVLETFTIEDGLAEDQTLMILQGQGDRILFLSINGRLSCYNGNQFDAIETDIIISISRRTAQGGFGAPRAMRASIATMAIPSRLLARITV